MNRVLIIVGAIVALMLPAGALQVRTAAAAQSSNTAPSSYQLQEARVFRQAAGFSADDATISQSYTDPLQYSDTEFGPPLTPAEAALIASRIEFSAAYGPALDAATAVKGYAGSFLDQATSSVLTILTAGDQSEMQAALAPLVPTGGKLVVVSSAADLAGIDARKNLIMNSFGTLRGLGYSPFSLAFDPIRQAYVVGVTSAAVKATAELTTLFGSDVVAEVSEPPTFLTCNSINDCGSMGGLGITGIPNSMGTYLALICSSGFIVRPTSSSSTRYIMTAGHCIYENGGPTASTSAWRSTAQTVQWGRNIASAFVNGTSSDTGTFLLAPAAPSIKNQYFVSKTDLRSVSQYATDAEQTVGSWWCRSGYTSGYDCGPIYSWHQWFDGFTCPGSTDCRINNAIVVTMVSDHGDSGAGFIQTDRDNVTTAGGVLFGGNSVTTWYTTVANAMSALSIRLCLNPTCS